MSQTPNDNTLDDEVWDDHCALSIIVIMKHEQLVLGSNSMSQTPKDNTLDDEAHYQSKKLSSTNFFLFIVKFKILCKRKFCIKARLECVCKYLPHLWRHRGIRES